MKLSWKPLLLGGLLTGSIACNLYLAYLVVDQGVSYSYQSDSLKTEHDRAETLLAVLDLKRSYITTSDLKALAQKHGWDSFPKKTGTSELFVLNGVGFRVEKNKVLAIDVFE
jgi:hypothetical protein